MRVRSESAHGWLFRPEKQKGKVACLRGPVNGGAEKNSVVEQIPTRKGEDPNIYKL